MSTIERRFDRDDYIKGLEGVRWIVVGNVGDPVNHLVPAGFAFHKREALCKALPSAVVWRERPPTSHHKGLCEGCRAEANKHPTGHCVRSRDAY